MSFQIRSTLSLCASLIIKDKSQELFRRQAELKDKLARKTTEAAKYKNDYYTIIIFVLVILFFLAFLKFRDFEIIVNTDILDALNVAAK